MKAEDIYKMINMISWGKRYCIIEDDDGQLHHMVIRSLTVDEKNYSEFLYDMTLQKLIAEGAATKAELVERYSNKGIWTKDNEERLEYLKGRIESLNAHKKLYEFQRSKKKIIQKQIDDAEIELDKLVKQREDVLSLSAEISAEQVKHYYELDKSVCNFEGKAFWPNGVGEERNLSLISNVIQNINKIALITDKEFREIARSNQWGLYWQAGKNIGVFGQDIKSYTLDQLQLCYWSRFYDAIHEMYEGPSEEIIADDELLDAWLERYHFNKGRKSSVSGRKHNSTTIVEEFIMADQMGADDVYKMNAPRNRMQIIGEQKRIGKEGDVTEWNLRQNKIMMDSNRKG